MRSDGGEPVSTLRRGALQGYLLTAPYLVVLLGGQLLSNASSYVAQYRGTLFQSCDMRNFKASLPKQLDVMVRRVPYAEPVICMVNEVDLSQLR